VILELRGIDSRHDLSVVSGDVRRQAALIFT